MYTSKELNLLANLDVASSGPWSVGFSLLSVITDMKRYYIDILGILKQCFYGSTHGCESRLEV